MLTANVPTYKVSFPSWSLSYAPNKPLGHPINLTASEWCGIWYDHSGQVPTPIPSCCKVSLCSEAVLCEIPEYQTFCESLDSDNG